MNTNRTCEACERELSAYVDGALSAADSRAVELHVETCAGCRLRLAEYREVAAALAVLPEIQAPLWLESRVLETVAARANRERLWSRGFALAGALSFALGIGLIAYAPRLSRTFHLPDPATWPWLLCQTAINAVVSVTKRLAVDVTFYQPIAKQLLLAVSALGALPRAALLTMRTTEAQAVVAVAFTLGVALYFTLRPSRTHEGGVGHACLSL